MNGRSTRKRLTRTVELVGLAVASTGLIVLGTGLAGTLLGHGYAAPAVVSVVATTPIIGAIVFRREAGRA